MISRAEANSFVALQPPRQNRVHVSHQLSYSAVFAFTDLLQGRGSGGDCNGQCHPGEATLFKSSW